MRWIAIVIIGVALTFSSSVYASSGIISPLSEAESPAMTNQAPVVITNIPNVLGAQSSLSTAVMQFLSATPSPTPLTTPTVKFAGQTPTPTPTPLPKSTRKPQMTITLVGDSMIDTLGPDGGALATRLNKAYPNTKFTVINHGVGGENIDSGLKRLTNGYTYLGASRPSVISQSPDVIVVESFGYNPYSYDIGALTTHWMQMATMMNVIKQNLPQTKIVIAATIAPNWDVFGDGAPFINMNAKGKREKVATIDSYIESTIAFANGEHYPLADVYHSSRSSDGNGMLQYINGGDHIHYSDAGRALFSQTVANTIISQRVLE
jgi:lysophospholipase L1-like esterase